MGELIEFELHIQAPAYLIWIFLGLYALLCIAAITEVVDRVFDAAYDRIWPED